MNTNRHEFPYPRNTRRDAKLFFSSLSVFIRVYPWLAVAISVCASPLAFAEERKTDSEQFIGWLLESDRDLKGIPFPQVVQAATGHKVLPFDLKAEADRELISKIGKAMDEVLKQMNAADSPAQKQKRINEASSHFENEMKRVLNEAPGFSCDFPHLKSGKVQRSGYPDLRLKDEKTGRIIYLDPKLYEQGSRDSSFRTFYYEPKTETNKILDDAHHLIVGIEHSGKEQGSWKFLNWELVDLSTFRVRLKAEFQGSNRDMYRKEAVVGTSRKE